LDNVSCRRWRAVAPCLAAAGGQSRHALQHAVKNAGLSDECLLRDNFGEAKNRQQNRREHSARGMV